MSNKKSKEKILLPAKEETAAISLKPRTAALCYDRVWSPTDTLIREYLFVPEPIVCFGGTDQEIRTGHLNPICILEAKAPLRVEKNSEVFGLLKAIAAIESCGSNEPYEKKEFALREFSDFEEQVILEGLQSHCLRDIAISFTMKHSTPLIPIYNSLHYRDCAYHQGCRQSVVAMLSNLMIVDEKGLSWDQVLGFRKDKEAREKYKRFLHWLDKEMIGKSQAFIENDIALKLQDYEWALKKHGIKTVIGTISETLDGKYLLGTTTVAASLVLAGYPTLAMLAGAGLVVGKVGVKLAEALLDFDDVERGQFSEISWVYEVKKLTM